MRRIVGLLFLIALLAVAFGVNRLTSNWHYVVPVEAGQVAYIATFDDSADDWDLYEGILSAQIVNGGRLQLKAGDVNSGPFSSSHPHFADFDVRTEAIPVAGPLDNGYGIIFRLQDQDNTNPSDDSYFWFMISSDGYYQVMRVLDGQQKIISDWIPSPAIQGGLGVSNWLRVVAVNDQFTFYINGQPAFLCLPDNPEGASTYNELLGGCVSGQMVSALADSTIPSGRLGVIVHAYDEPGVVVDFDHFVVYGPDPVTE